MVLSVVSRLAVAVAATQLLGLSGQGSVAAFRLDARAGDEPGLPHDPATTSYCSWWMDHDGSQTCQEILDFNWIKLSDFRRWNPSVGSDCSGLTSGKSYCVEAWDEPPPPPEAEPTTTSSTSKAVPSTTAAPSTTKPPTTIITSTSTSTTSAGNGIETPAPVQGGIVKNCNKFHFVESGDTCAVIAQKYNLRTADVVSWNGLNSGCTNLWGETYACVGLIGGTAPPASTTTTSAGNGIATPTPVQNGIVKNCNKFHFVESGDSCAAIAQRYNIRVADVVSWNGLNSGCTNIWAETYACIGLIGGVTPPTTTAKTTTTTAPGNGVSTPTPVQNGIVKNCNKFHFVQGGETCAVIAQKYNIRVADVVSWNGLNSGCTNIWAETYACIGLIGQTTPPPTTTKPPTGPATPSPIQAGMVQGCTKWHFIGGTTTCSQVLSYNKITLAQFFKWNPAVKADCSGLWKDTHACVAGP